FGLLGHLRNVAVASGCRATVWLEKVPVLDAAWTYVREGIAPGGTHANLRFLREHTTFADDIEEESKLVLADAQTSGGLLLAVEPSRAGALVAALGRFGTPAAAVIGHTVEGTPGRIGIR
ncbi:MAG TPA: AIR synthase-related protein, partial [Acidimicrobiia bacterium]|nr:AIR synthase-related protein [Acidimicrobiia bacterium]